MGSAHRGPMAELPIDHAIDPAVFARSGSNMRSLAAVLPRLEWAPSAVPDLLALAPELVCELGFDRSLVSRVADGIWYPEPIYIAGDPAWIAEIAAARATAPIPFAPGKPETTIVRASRTRCYIAAPILSGDEVVGVLTADRYRSRRAVDEFDRDLLAVFAVVFQLALTRAALAERLHATEDLLGRVSRACRAHGSSIRRTPPSGSSAARATSPVRSAPARGPVLRAVCRTT